MWESKSASRPARWGWRAHTRAYADPASVQGRARGGAASAVAFGAASADHPGKKWLNWLLGVLFFLMVALLVMGLLARH